jgi:hypothetical protein
MMSTTNSTLSVSTETHLTVSSPSLDLKRTFDIAQARGLRLVAAAPNRIVAGKTFDETVTVAGPHEIVQELVELVSSYSKYLLQFSYSVVEYPV